MLFEYFNYKGLIPTSDIQETFDTLSLSTTLSVPMSEFIPKLFDELKTLSSRDDFELFFDVCGNHIKILDCSADSLRKLQGHIADNSDESEYEIELKIRKNQIESTFSIYFLDKFSEYLEEESLLNLIRTISEHFSHNLKFEVFSTIDSFGSDSIKFFQAQEFSQTNGTFSELNRADKLELLSENSSTSNININVLPSDFYLLYNSSYHKINEFFHKACATLSLIFISNSSELKNTDLLSYKINGYKTVTCDGVTVTSLSEIYKLLFKIYAWAYEGGNSSDKIGLVRNVLSIHLDSNGNIKFDIKAWEAIKSNYQIYLKGNIQSYLEVKNKIGEFVIESTSKTYVMADEILDSLKNNILILLTFLLSAVVVDGFKDNGQIIIFSNRYLAIVIILTLISSLWLLMTKNELVNRFDSASDTIKEILRLNYNKILMESEIDECVDPVIIKNKNYLNNQIKRYSFWWATILTVFMFSFVVANMYFSETENGKDNNVKHQSMNIEEKL